MYLRAKYSLFPNKIFSQKYSLNLFQSDYIPMFYHEKDHEKTEQLFFIG